MAYVTLTDLLERVGEDDLYIVAGTDAVGNLDERAIDRAAADAAAEIDAYLGKRYTVPVTPVPRVLQRIAVDITLYQLADAGRAGGSDMRRQRYEDALAMLKRLASGEITLGIGGADGNGDAAGEATPEIVGDSILDDDNPPRLFGRRRGNGWPV